jgi:hypothetical protein
LTKVQSDRIFRTVPGVLMLGVLLAGCASAKRMMPDIGKSLPAACAGWTSLPLKEHTAARLQGADPELVARLDAHNLRGRNLGCWP